MLSPRRNADSERLIKLQRHFGTNDTINGIIMDGKKRADVKPGCQVEIVLKKDQRTGVLTVGKVKDILTKSPTHPHGIKVRLESGEVGRVKNLTPRT